MSITMDCNGKNSAGYFVINKIKRLGFEFEKATTPNPRSGVNIVKSRLTEKTISVDFTVCDDSRDVPTMRQKIASEFINENDNRLSFDDMPNVFFIADLVSFTCNEINKYLATGTITFLVSSGVAHSTSLDNAVAKVDSNGILAMDIDYKGTEKTPLTLTIHNNAETGFLGAIGMHGDENTFLTQLGYVDEADGEIREKAKIIIGKDGGVFSNWTDATTFYENQEKAIVAKMPVTTAYGGWMGGIPADAKKSGTKKWYGTAKELILPNPIESAYLWGRAWFETGKMGQTGQWTLAYVDENNLFVAGMAISKGDKSGNSATVYFLINEGSGTKIYKSIPMTPSYWLPPNPYGSQARNDNRNMFDLRKEGEKITFFWNGGYHSVNVPFLKGKKVKRVQFYTGQYADRTPQQAVPNMGLRDVLVADLKSQYWENLPNRFSAGSDVIITKENAMNMIYRDGIQTLEDFITGSNFPYLVPGKNHIEFHYSPFTTVPPTITGTYEKRFV